jgi:preprotein translocase subunit SecA
MGSPSVGAMSPPTPSVRGGVTQPGQGPAPRALAGHNVDTAPADGTVEACGPQPRSMTPAKGPPVLTGLLDGSRTKHRQHRRDLDQIASHWAELEPLDDTAFDRHIADARSHGSRHERIAVAAETIRRTLGLRLHPNQLAGALALTDRQVVELATGEGKTVMVVPFVFAAVADGATVHIATANSYLAGRDATWMAPAYTRLGVTVAHLDDTLAGAREALTADVCYGTVPTFATVWLADQLATSADRQRWRQADMCVVDEADAVLLDLVRAPITLTRAVPADPQHTLHCKELADLLTQADENGENGDWGVDEAAGVAALLETGIDRIEAELGITLYDGTHSDLIAGITDALVARALMQAGRDYLVENGTIVPINPMTGRTSAGRFRVGLHSALEAKENLTVTDDAETLAQIAAGAFLSRYPHLCGMTATAVSARDEFIDLYSLDTFALEPHVPCQRRDHHDVIVRTAAEKFDAVCADTLERHHAGQPVLIGVDTIDDLNQVAGRLEAAGVPVRRLSAQNHADEAAVLAAAGHAGAVTVATRMAGRGIDIVLGGDPTDAEKVRDAGGLCVLGAQRFDSRRGDDQLRGRAGRQGDPGASRFYVSLEDDLIRIYAGDALTAAIERLNRLQGDLSGHKQMTRLLDKAQAAKSGQQHGQRKSLLAYDAVLGAQRDRFYRLRQQILTATDHQQLDQILAAATPTTAAAAMQHAADGGETGLMGVVRAEEDRADDRVEEGVTHAEADTASAPAGSTDDDLDERRRRLLGLLDRAWRRHLADCAMLRNGIGLRRLGQRNPLTEYQQETGQLYTQHLADALAEAAGRTDLAA